MIKKISNYTQEMMKQHEDNYTIEYVGNAHHYFSNFIKQSDIIRKTRNPHGIKTEVMISKFGQPNFIDDYKESSWWILSYKNNTWAVDTNEREGSGVHRFYNDNIDRTLDKQHSIEMGEFINELYDILTNVIDNPINLEPVIAQIEHMNDLGKSKWYEVVYFDKNWQSYSGSKTFEDGEKVIKWKYCKDCL